MSTKTEPARGPPNPGRRRFMKTVGAGAGALAFGAGGQAATDQQAIGEAEALVPLVVAAAGATAVGWLLRDHGVIGADDPGSGLTPEVLQQQVYDTARTRKSTNASTFIDNQNIVSAGLENTLYSEGKLAAIEAIDNGDAEADVNTAAQDAVASHMTTVKQNLLKSWNESVNEFSNLRSAAESHGSVVPDDVFSLGGGVSNDTSPQLGSTRSVSLPDGTSLSIETMRNGADSWNWDPIQQDSGASNPHLVAVNPDGSNAPYLMFDEWNAVWSALETAQTNAENGLGTWVSNVYDQVQTGEIAVADLLSSTDLAELAPDDDEDFNRAVTDLLALNIPVDLQREAEISLSSINGTLYGLLAATGETTVSAGDTIDPSTASEDYYLTYDVSEGHGEWTDFQTSVDGGTVTFTSEPLAQTLYTISTSHGETAEVTTSDFTEDSGTWTVDVSGQLENPITNIDTVEFFAESDETNMVTVKLTETFTVESFTNEETGESEDSATYEPPTQPEDDTNYISQEEWDQREEQIQTLIDQYEESTNEGGGGSILPDLGTGGILGGVVAIGATVYLAGQALGN